MTLFEMQVILGVSTLMNLYISMLQKEILQMFLEISFGFLRIIYLAISRKIIKIKHLYLKIPIFNISYSFHEKYEEFIL